MNRRSFLKSTVSAIGLAVVALPSLELPKTFAKGGYIGGGQKHFGIMGESGGESILPLKRNIHGKLGINNDQ